MPPAKARVAPGTAGRNDLGVTHARRCRGLRGRRDRVWRSEL